MPGDSSMSALRPVATRRYWRLEPRAPCARRGRPITAKIRRHSQDAVDARPTGRYILSESIHCLWIDIGAAFSRQIPHLHRFSKALEIPCLSDKSGPRLEGRTAEPGGSGVATVLTCLRNNDNPI